MTDNRIKIHCNPCQRETWHSVLREEEKNFSDDRYYECFVYVMAECCGCECIKLHITEISDSCNRTQGGQIIPSHTIYPPKTFRSQPKWLGQLFFPFSLDAGSQNKDILALFNEIYISLQNGCKRVAVMGLRALLEHIMIQKCEDKGSFIKNMDAFEQAGFVSKIQRQALDVVLEVGHATIHRSFSPSDAQVIAALDVTENIVESIYIVSKVGDGKAFDNVPPRSTQQ